MKDGKEGKVGMSCNHHRKLDALKRAKMGRIQPKTDDSLRKSTEAVLCAFMLSLQDASHIMAPCSGRDQGLGDKMLGSRRREAGCTSSTEHLCWHKRPG